MSCWGNLPLTRKKYLAKCKQHHPDKGGDPNVMKRMTELYEKLEATVMTVHTNEQGSEWTWDTSKVYFDFVFHPSAYSARFSPATVGEVFGIEAFEKHACYDWTVCINSYNRKCKCTLCTLRRRHKERYKRYRRPLVWIDCYCYDCYTTWFCLPVEWRSFCFWKLIIFQTPLSALKV